MTDEQIFEIASQHFNFIRKGSAIDGMGDLVRIEPSSFVVKSKLLHGLLKFAQEMYDEGYDQGCYEATGGQ